MSNQKQSAYQTISTLVAGDYIIAVRTGTNEKISFEDLFTQIGLPTSYQKGVIAAGTDKTNATPINKAYNRIDTVAAGTGVVNDILEVAGEKRTVQNNGVNDLNYYPFLGSNFYVNGTGAMAADAPMVISPGNQVSYIAYEDGELTII